MKKKISIFILTILSIGLLLLSFNACGGLGNDDDGVPAVYIAGYTVNGSSSTTVPCYWIDGVRTDLSVLDSTKSGHAYSIYVNGIFVTVGGSTVDSSNVEVPCYWINDTVRNDLSVISPGFNGAVNDIIQPESILYSAGYTTEDHASLTQWVPCYWENAARTDITEATAARYGVSFAIDIDASNTIYMSGYTRNDLDVYVPCYWENGTRNDLEVTNSAHIGYAWDIQAVGTDIYTAGFTRDGSDIAIPCYWIDTVKHDLTDVITTAQDGIAYSISVNSSVDIYIAGNTKNNSGIAVPCYWHNGTRTNLSVIDSSKQGQTRSIFIIGTDIYIAGYTVNSSDVSVPCYWLNDIRTDLPVLDSNYLGVAQEIFVVE